MLDIANTLTINVTVTCYTKVLLIFDVWQY